METIGTVVSLAVILAIFYTYLRWYWNEDGRLNSEWFK